jgi:riboflavin synthase alpha subunit
MFTGLIESVGRVAAVEPVASGIRLRVATELAGQLSLGDSVAVNGVCLTVTATAGGELHADIGPETARVTTLGSLAPGQPVNLERSMRADSRFGGHFVQGHVDATGTVVAVRADGESHWLSIAFPAQIAAYLVAKGSIAVDGISLTVATLGDDRFEVMIIPFTWEHTNIASLRPGDRVNLEGDMVGKYVARGVELAAARIAR